MKMNGYFAFLVLLVLGYYTEGSVKTAQKTPLPLNQTIQAETFNSSDDTDSDLVVRQLPPPSACNCYYQDSCGCYCQTPITWEDFQLLPQQFRSCPQFTLALRGGTFHSFPADYFYRVGDVQDFVLDISDIQFQYLLDPEGDTSSLNRVTFQVASFLRFFRITVAQEWNWGGFYDLSPTRPNAYCEIQVVQSTVPLLKEDFGRICKGAVTVVNINYSGTMALENRVFASFLRLTEVNLSNNRIRVMMRSYFPHPANELAIFNLSFNDIRRLPRDMFYGMPALRSVDLRGNPITTIDEAAFRPYFRNINFMGLERFNISKKQAICNVKDGSCANDTSSIQKRDVMN